MRPLWHRTAGAALTGAVALALTGLAPAPATAPLAESPETMVVSADWLRQHLADPGLVVLAVGPEASYRESHIPGARYLSLRDISTRSEAPPLSLELLPVPVLDSVFESLGVSDGSRIVIYWDGEWVTPTTRVWFTLDRLGLGDRASILDGGLPAWVAAGGEVTAEAPAAPSRGRITPRARNVVVEADWLAKRLDGAGIALIDARTPNFYDGSESGGQPRAGHIPGAKNVAFPTIVDEGDRFKSPEALNALLAEAGAGPGKTVVAYCHIGQQATLVYFAARRLGYDVRLYDGSFQDWSRRMDLPVVQLKQARAQLLSTERLGQVVSNPEWRMTIIDARSDLGEYLQGHVPGAVFLHNETLRWTGNGVPADLLPGESYRALFERLGVRRDRPVVVYGAGGANNFHATFVTWLLKGFDHPTVYLLDGGYGKWAEEGRPVTQKYPKVEPGSLAGGKFSLALATTADVQRAVERRDVLLVDARPPAQYSGQAGPQLRRGHLPGAVNHPWITDLAGEPAKWIWKPKAELESAYGAHGITPDKDIIVYCNTGTEASHLYFALAQVLDYPRVRVYVPSWTEWSEREDLPIE